MITKVKVQIHIREGKRQVHVDASTESPPSTAGFLSDVKRQALEAWDLAFAQTGKEQPDA